MTDTLNEKLDWSIVLVIIVGTIMSILVASSVNVALPTMMVLFSVGSDDIQWILTAYMLTMGVIMSLSGYLGDRFGYKRVYCIALSLFTLGSLACGLSWNLPSMLVSRVLQALGGGLMQPIGMTMVYRSYPRERIGQVMGVYGIAALAAPAIGPTLGGYLIAYASWKILFLYNVPLGVLALFLAVRLLKETPRIKGKKLDVVGLITISFGLFCLLLAISSGNNHGWSSPYIIILFAMAAVLLTTMVINEINHPEPVLDLRLLKDLRFSTSLVIGSTLAMGMFGATFLMPLYLQNIMGQTAMQTGIIMLPAAILSAIMMPISGKIFDRWGARTISIIGLALVTIGTFAMSKFDLVTPFAIVTLWMAFRSAGMGIAMMPVNTAGMLGIPARQVGQASSLNNVIRQVAAAFGVAMFTTIMQHREVFHYANLAQNVNANMMAASQSHLLSGAAAAGMSASTSQLIGFGVLVKQLTLMALNYGINDCFSVATIICLVSVALAFLLKDKKSTEVNHEIEDLEEQELVTLNE